jgi:hypothetical protein
MPIPWLQIMDAVIGLTDLARSRKIGKMARAGREAADESQQQLEATGRGAALGGLETRLAGVVVAALKEAFDRDNRRLDLEREQLAAERERADLALRLELRRQAADREIGHLRLLAGIAVASWLATLFFATRVIGGVGAGKGARLALGGGWLLLLLAFVLAFVGQSKVTQALNRNENAPLGSSGAGSLAVWFIFVGCALVGLAVLAG